MKIDFNNTILYYGFHRSVAPTIVDMPDMQQTIVVKENENVRLKCTASGNPKPDITWRRDDNKAINLGTVSRNLLLLIKSFDLMIDIFSE